jgi:hypothetical protein
MVAAVSGQIVFELDIEQPVHAFDPPVAADAIGQPFDVESSRKTAKALGLTLPATLFARAEEAIE